VIRVSGRKAAYSEYAILIDFFQRLNHYMVMSTINQSESDYRRLEKQINLFLLRCVEDDQVSSSVRGKLQTIQSYFHNKSIQDEIIYAFCGVILSLRQRIKNCDVSFFTSETKFVKGVERVVRRNQGGLSNHVLNRTVDLLNGLTQYIRGAAIRYIEANTSPDVRFMEIMENMRMILNIIERFDNH